MDKKIKEQIKEQISKQLQDLTEEIKDMEERSQTVNLDEPIGRLSRMDSITNQGIALSSLNKAKIRLTRLEMALKRIDEDDEFGYCENCGEDIAIKRLMALPESTLCIHCAK
ncbi:MAG: TraR/DksA C4-type zinc finger protein [Desulfovibrionales bacterium]|nr:TraR/DksA C4-type zinc finger protein [Desulfovibrionales bacterium]